MWNFRPVQLAKLGQGKAQITFINVLQTYPIPTLLRPCLSSPCKGKA